MEGKLDSQQNAQENKQNDQILNEEVVQNKNTGDQLKNDEIQNKNIKRKQSSHQQMEMSQKNQPQQIEKLHEQHLDPFFLLEQYNKKKKLEDEMKELQAQNQLKERMKNKEISQENNENRSEAFLQNETNSKNKKDQSVQWESINIEQQLAKRELSEIKKKDSEQKSQIQSQDGKIIQKINEAQITEQKDGDKLHKYESESIKSSKTSEKKPKSFVIHSKSNSIRSKKKSASFRDSRVSCGSEKKEISLMEIQAKRENKREDEQFTQKIQGMRSQIYNLKSKIEKIEKKGHKNIPEYKQSEIMIEENQLNSQIVSPLRKTNPKLKLQSRLSFDRSIVQFSTYEDKMKRVGQQTERLEGQVVFLKQLVRQLQMEKIKSIENGPNFGTSIPQDHYQSRGTEKWNNSLNMETRYNSGFQDEERKNFKHNTLRKTETEAESQYRYNKLNASRGLYQSEIKEKKNNRFHVPRKTVFKGRKEEKVEAGRESCRDEIISKFDENEKNFQQFLETSRIKQTQDKSKNTNEMQQKKLNSEMQPKLVFPQKNKSEIKKQIFDKKPIKGQNPQDEDYVVEEIVIGNIQFPVLPGLPNSSMSQEQFQQLAKRTYYVFGIDLSSKQAELSIKKYKNCCAFFLNNSHQVIIWHYTGKFYIGGWKNSDSSEGEKVGQGLQFIPDKYVYKGQFFGGKKNGTGMMKLTNDNIYEGQWADGMKNGLGIYYEAHSKTIYKGQWKNGKRDGSGLLKFSDNSFYKGTFLQSVKHGFGIEKFANGDFYKGEYQKGKFNGKGKYVWANGSSYEGSFVEGSRQGHGSWKSSRSGGDVYHGGYEEDKKSGYGRYIWSNGCIYEGNFKNDLKDGKGRIIYRDGKEVKGRWELGNFKESDENKKIQDHEQSPLKKSLHLSSFLDRKSIDEKSNFG